MLLKLDNGHKIPGHGESRVEINFWYFLFVYYGFYNITALMWITKVFNIYSLNWYVSLFAASEFFANMNKVARKFWFPINRLYHRNHLNSNANTDILLLGNTVDNIT
jgi:hypothetical protein